MQTSVINKSKLERTLRIDGEYYQEKYLQVEISLSRLSNIKPITELCKVSDGNHMSIAQHFNYEQGIPYYRGQDITDFFLENVTPVFIPKEIYNTPLMKRSHFKVGDVLLSIVGTIGNLSLVTKDIQESTGSCKIAILRPKDIYSEYLAIYLMSKYGNEQIKRNTRGAVQTGLILEDFSQIYVVSASESFQRIIADVVNESLSKNNDSRKFYFQAEQILLSELGLVDWKPKHRLSYVKNYSNVQESERIDAEYYQPQYEEIVKTIKKYKGGFEELRNLTSLVGHPSNPPYETKGSENKTFVITQRHLAQYFPVDDFWKDEEALYTTDEFMEKNKKYILKENDLILYSVGAYIGKANIYNSKIKATIGSFLTLIRADQKVIDPFYLLVFLNSSIGRLLTRRNSRGLAQQYIYPYDTKKVIVPLVKKNIQEKIASLVLKGQHTNNTSKFLLEIAKRGVEMAIEKSEAEAEKWMNAEEIKIVEGKL